MNIRRLLVAAAAMALVPMTAGATQVAWMLQGTIDGVQAFSGPTISAGDPFSLVLNFDTSTPVSNPFGCADGGAGRRCNHNGGTTQFLSSITIGGNAFGSFLADPSGNNQIFVRNNTPWNCDGDPNTGVDGNECVVDGYTWVTSQLYLDGDQWILENIGLIFRGPEDLNIVTDARVLPEFPPSGLLGLGTHVFQYCKAYADANGFPQGDCLSAVHGQVTAVSSVPEPATLALFGLGLAGLAIGRRRKN